MCTQKCSPRMGNGDTQVLQGIYLFIYTKLACFILRYLASRHIFPLQPETFLLPFLSKNLKSTKEDTKSRFDGLNANDDGDETTYLLTIASKCYSIWSWCIGIKEDDEISAIISLLSKKVPRSSIIKTKEFHTVVARTNNSACNSFLFTFVVLIDAQASPVPTKREECNKYMINEKNARDSSLCLFTFVF